MGMRCVYLRYFRVVTAKEVAVKIRVSEQAAAVLTPLTGDPAEAASPNTAHW